MSKKSRQNAERQAAIAAAASPRPYRKAPGDTIDDLIRWRPAVARLHSAADDAKQADARLREAVLAARVDGCSWAVVGDAIGVSRQAAYQRFGR